MLQWLRRGFRDRASQHRSLTERRAAWEYRIWLWDQINRLVRETARVVAIAMGALLATVITIYLVVHVIDGQCAPWVGRLIRLAGIV
jgi:hypothetical protein